MKILNIKELILLNQYVQGIIPREEIDNWFLRMDESDKQSVVKNIWVLATQAQITENDIPAATVAAGLKPTHTPVIMLSKKGNLTFHNRGYRLSELKGTVLNQAYWFVLECFALAERRRKDKEKLSECNHWWHKDLSDESIIKDILKNN